ncbi:T9SS type A sorting domain-containing protein [Fibrobacter sp.]|uniref:T9SS type A sorting domain-containing protein n=1 Tax=Fibrobacter sp. TaxID=35828 RepID=UPI0038631842
MNKHFGMKNHAVFRAGIVLAMGANASFAALEWVPQCASNGFTQIAESAHFEVCKKPTTDDGQANNVTISTADAQAAIDELENVFSFYTDSLGWMLPFPKSPEKKLKSNVYVYDNSVMAALYGGQDYVKDLNGEYGPGMWIGVGSLKDRWGMAHEFAHGLQGVAGWLGNNSHTGWMAESHANWMAHQYISEDAHYCSEALINFSYLYYGSTRDRYCNWQFLEHLKEEFGGGNQGAAKVNRIWMESIRDGEDGRMEQTPFTAMMKVYGWTLEQLNDEFGKFAMKNATLEYAPAKKALYKKTWGDYEFATRRDASGWGDMYRRHPRVTMLNKMECAAGEKCADRYISPSYWAPQRWGYNLVRIYPDSAGKVTVKFRGIVQEKPTVQGYTCFGDNTDYYKGKTYKWCNYAPDALPDPASGWTVGLVAEGSDGTPRYSEMKHGTGFNLEIETKASDKALWLAVTATPTEMQTILWDQFYYSIYRYPYMIEVVNGAPEGYNKDFWKPANANSYSKHSNGGGLVSSKAKVAATAYVGPDAVVNGGTVSGNARIEDFAVVNGGTIGDNAIVRGRALVSAGTIADDAVLEEDAWLVNGTISGKAKVGALSIIAGNTTVTDNAQVYGIMWAVTDKKMSGTAQLRGDLENNFTKEISKGVFYGMVDDGMLSNANYGANLTTPPTDATASIENAQWYAVKDDSTSSVTLIDSHRKINHEIVIHKTADKLHFALPHDTHRITITDIHGHTLIQRNGKATTLSITNLPQGIYYVIVRTGTGNFTKRFIK